MRLFDIPGRKYIVMQISARSKFSFKMEKMKHFFNLRFSEVFSLRFPYFEFSTSDPR